MNDLTTVTVDNMPSVVSPTTQGVLMRAEIDQQIATAHAFPRSIKQFKAKARDIACLDPETAGACIYSLPRGGKHIEGPSVRLAEIIAGAYGNLRAGARVINQDNRFITAQGVCHDLQNNICITIEVQRRITNKNGQTFPDDMIAVTANAACSIALRNAIFRVIPKAMWEDVYHDAVRVFKGDAKSLVSRRDATFQGFVKMGVSEPRVLMVLGRQGLDDVTAEDLVTLKGLWNSVKEGELTLEVAFPEPKKVEAAASQTEKIAAAIEDKKPRKKKEAEPAVDLAGAANVMIQELYDIARELDVDIDAELDGRKLEEVPQEALKSMLDSYRVAVKQKREAQST